MQTTALPEIREPGTSQGDHCVIIFNNNTNSMEEVVFILQLATGCPQDEAEMEMWEAHHRGRAYVHFADKAECERVATIIRTIGVRTMVEEF